MGVGSGHCTSSGSSGSQSSLTSSQHGAHNHMPSPSRIVAGVCLPSASQFSQLSIVTLLLHPLLSQIRSSLTLALATVIEIDMHRLQPLTTIYALQLRYSIRSPRSSVEIVIVVSGPRLTHSTYSPVDLSPFTVFTVRIRCGNLHPSSVFTSKHLAAFHLVSSAATG